MRAKLLIASITLLPLLLVAACVEDNPYGANPDVGWQGGDGHPQVQAWGTLSGGLGSTVLNDLDPDNAGIQDALLLSFDRSMSPGLMTSSAFEIVETSPGSGQVDVEEVIYHPEIRRVEVHATFADETAYLLTVPAGTLTDLVGNPLDPNRNAIEDGSPWDDLRVAYHSGSAEETDLNPPTVSQHSPQGGGLTERLPQVTILFSDGPMDVSTLTLQNLTMVRTSDSAAVSMSLDMATAQTMMATPNDSLDFGERYTLRLSAAVADSAGNTLDGNGDGYLWPDERDYTWDIQIADDGSSHGNPPGVRNAEGHLGWFKINFEESLTGDQVIMDQSTLITENVQAMDDLGMIPLDLVVDMQSDGVYCYLQRSASGPVVVWVSANVRDQYGNGLDGNGDGLGGTPGEDDWSTQL
jgi:hypothetical protein